MTQLGTAGKTRAAGQRRQMFLLHPSCKYNGNLLGIHKIYLQEG